MSGPTNPHQWVSLMSEYSPVCVHILLRLEVKHVSSVPHRLWAVTAEEKEDESIQLYFSELLSAFGELLEYVCSCLTI